MGLIPRCVLGDPLTWKSHPIVTANDVTELIPLVTVT